MKKTLVAVIDSYVVRKGVVLQLTQMGFDIVIEASDGDDFMGLVTGSLVPEVMDIDTPFIDEFMAAKQIKAQYPDVKIIAYTLYERDYPQAIQYGIDSFMPKNCLPDELKSNILELAHS